MLCSANKVVQVNAPQELDVHDNIVRLGLSSKGPPVRAKYMVLGLCSHDSSKNTPIAETDDAHMWCDITTKLSHRILATLGLSSPDSTVKTKYMLLGLSAQDSSLQASKARTKYAQFWCDTTAKLLHRHPVQTRSSPAELFYLHHVRSSASSPRGASGTGSTPARAYWKSSTPQWLLDALEVAVPVAYKCLEVVVVSQLFPVTWMHACMGALMPWHSTVVSHAAWWAFAEGTVAQQFLSVAVMFLLLQDVHYIMPVCRSMSILATYALMPQTTSATVSTLLVL